MQIYEEKLFGETRLGKMLAPVARKFVKFRLQEKWKLSQNLVSLLPYFVFSKRKKKAAFVTTLICAYFWCTWIRI